MRLILLGPPGAGKGTQAKLLSQRLKIPHISTGDILREEVRENSQLGEKIAGFVKSGELVPDATVVEVVMKRLSKPDAQCGFILDGFPRTFNQAEALSTALSKQNIPIDLVIYFETSREISIERLSGRRVCKSCGANFHLINMKPRKDGVCDFCGQELFLRDDDRTETIRKRLKIYQEQTTGLIDYYKNGNLRKVCGDLGAKQLNDQLMDLFAQENLNEAQAYGTK